MTTAPDSNSTAALSIRTDLHAHSTCSDGGVSPEKLVELALAEGLSLLALTDHDTVAGVERLQQAAAGTGLVVVPAVELSTHWQGTSVHLLGYFPTSWHMDSEPGQRLQEWLRILRQHREARNRSLAARLHAHGIHLDLDQLAVSLSPRMTVDQLGRPHIARWLMERGHALSIGDAFALYLTPGAPTYVQLDGVPTEEAIQQIRQLGGLPGLAHPVRLKLPLAAMLDPLVEAGLQAIEVYYPRHTPEQQEEYRQLGLRFHLALTGGSDFHGRPGERLGSVPVPAAAMHGWVFWPAAQELAAISGQV